MRENVIKIRTTRVEEAVIENKARSCGMTVSRYIRELALGHDVAVKTEKRFSQDEKDNFRILSGIAMIAAVIIYLFVVKRAGKRSLGCSFSASISWLIAEHLGSSMKSDFDEKTVSLCKNFFLISWKILIFSLSSAWFVRIAEIWENKRE